MRKKLFVKENSTFSPNGFLKGVTVLKEAKKKKLRRNI